MSEVKKLRQEFTCILECGNKAKVLKELQSFVIKVKKMRNEARDDFLNTKKMYEENPTPRLRAELLQKQEQSAEIREFHQEVKILISFLKK